MPLTTLKRALLRFAVIFVLQTVSLAQSQPSTAPQPNNQQRNDDVEEKNPPDPSTTTPPAPEIQTIQGEDNDSADIPPFALPYIDTETYFRMRDEHVRLMRGLLDKFFDPRSRGEAIRQ